MPRGVTRPFFRWSPGRRSGTPGGRAVPSSESCGDNNYGLVPLPYDDVVGVGRLPLPCTLPGNPNLRIEDQLPRTVDENIAAPLADKLDKAGHDVERVVNVSELGEGVDDTTICQYAVQEGRLIVTSDDDFVQMPADSHCGVFYVPDQSLPPHDLYHIIQRVIEAFPSREAMETVTYITPDWL